MVRQKHGQSQNARADSKESMTNDLVALHASFYFVCKGTSLIPKIPF